MALFDGLLGGGSADPYDLYGDILTAKQREALRARSSDQTWANAANFLAKAAMPTNKKIPLGGLLAGLAGAMGGSNQDEAVQTALKGALTTQQIAKLRREQKLLAELDPIQKELLRRQLALGGGGAPAVPTEKQPSVQTVPPAAATTPPPMIVPPQPPVPAGGLPGLPPGATTALPAVTQFAGLLGDAPGSGGGEDIWSQLASVQGGVAPGTPPFDLASLGQVQGLPDVGSVQVEPLSGKAAPAGAFNYGVDYLQKTFGLEPHQARGAVKWMQNIESGLDPSIVNPRSGAFGVAQHLGPRKDKLLGQYGSQPSLEQQFSFIGDELRGPEAKALSSLKSARTEDEAFRVWGRDFERPSAAEYARATGLPNVGRVNIEPLGGTAAPAGGSGVIPGLGITPEALATLNSMYKAAGVDSPFGSLLDTYYKSPGYLEEKARTEAKATKDVALEMDPLIAKQTEIARARVEFEWKPKIEEAVQKLQSPILKEREQAKADIDRYSKALEQNRQAALTPTKATVFGPGGAVGTEEMTASEFARRQQERADRIGKGNTTFQPGDIVPTPTGAAPAEHEYRMTPQGALSAVPVPGTPAAEKAAEAASKKLQTEQQNLIARDTVVREVDNIGKLMESATLPTTGFAGSILQNLGGTSANDVRVARQTLESRLSRDALNAQRAASPTGAAFGNTSDADLAILRTSLVNLDQSQTKEQFKERLQILKQNYIDAVHGPGMSRLLPETQVLKKPEPPSAREWKSGDIVDYPDGSQRQLKGEEWVITKPPRR